MKCAYCGQPVELLDYDGLPMYRTSIALSDDGFSDDVLDFCGAECSKVWHGMTNNN